MQIEGCKLLKARETRLRIKEIFFSLQGETSSMGQPTVFIRLTGCPLRCQYCDSEYAFSGGDYYTVEQLCQEVDKYQTNFVTVTGGEPLAQKDCLPLLKALCDKGLRVSLETSGALDVSAVDPRVIKILDIKTPDSNECEKNLYSNLDFLTPKDEIKFVICSRRDFEFSRDLVAEHGLDDKYLVWFSPSYGQCEAATLADWILEEQLNVRFQCQLHKLLWGDIPGK